MIVDDEILFLSKNAIGGLVSHSQKMGPEKEIIFAIAISLIHDSITEIKMLQCHRAEIVDRGLAE